MFIVVFWIMKNVSQYPDGIHLSSLCLFGIVISRWKKGGKGKEKEGIPNCQVFISVFQQLGNYLVATTKFLSSCAFNIKRQFSHSHYHPLTKKKLLQHPLLSFTKLNRTNKNTFQMLFINFNLIIELQAQRKQHWEEGLLGSFFGGLQNKNKWKIFLASHNKPTFLKTTIKKSPLLLLLPSHPCEKLQSPYLWLYLQFMN